MGKVRKRVRQLCTYFVGLFRLEKIQKGDGKLQQELVSLELGRRQAVLDYYTKKAAAVLGILCAGFLLALVCLLGYMRTETGAAMSTLGRPDYGAGDKSEALHVQIEDESELLEVEVTVQERKYTLQQKREMLQQAMEELERTLPGANESLDEVRSDLVLPGSLLDGAVSITWTSSPYGIIGEDGTLQRAEDEHGTLVELQGTLSCFGLEQFYTAYANVFPPILPEEERFWQEIRKTVKKADEEACFEKVLVLPQEVEGRQLLWSRPVQNFFGPVLAGTLIAAACLWIQMDQKIHRRAEERKKQLLLDYPDLMWKLTMLLGAGLGIKASFIRIAAEYQREQRENGGRGMRYVYEEVVYTCREMDSGIPEAQSYERFGRRCQLPEYIRIGTVLSQNLKKGAQGLTALLAEEAETSLEDRKHRARKIGEQAGTKLLLPMMLMLCVVLAVLMVPAFWAF